MFFFKPTYSCGECRCCDYWEDLCKETTEKAFDVVEELHEELEKKSADLREYASQINNSSIKYDYILRAKAFGEAAKMVAEKLNLLPVF